MAAEPLARGPHRAAAASLFCFETEIAHTNMLDHDPALAACLGQLRRLAASLVREHGFVQNQATVALGVPTGRVEAVARVVRQLQHITPEPSLAPHLHTPPTAPRSFLLAVPLALVYVRDGRSGERAAAHCARFCSDDPRADACARAAASALTSILRGIADKDRIICAAAAAAQDESVSRRLRAMRVLRWEELRAGTDACSQLVRAVHTWYKARTYGEAMADLPTRLPDADTRRFAAVLNAATYGMSALPEDLMARAVSDAATLKLLHDLYAVANEGVLVAVASAPQPPAPSAALTTTRTVQAPAGEGLEATTPEPDAGTPPPPPRDGANSAAAGAPSAAPETASLPRVGPTAPQRPAATQPRQPRQPEPRVLPRPPSVHRPTWPSAPAVPQRPSRPAP